MNLRVMARGNAQVMHHYAAHPVHGSAPHKRLTHQHDPNVGPRFIDDEGNERRHGAFHKSVGDVIDVPPAQHVLRPTPHGWDSVWEDHAGTYIRDIRNGDLWPADAPTAMAVGAPFNLTGSQLERELAANSIPHAWRDLAVNAVESKCSMWEAVQKARDEEHGESAVAEHVAAMAALRGEYGGTPTKPKAVIV